MRRVLLACLFCVTALWFAAPAHAANGDYSIDELSTLPKLTIGTLYVLPTMIKYTA